MVVCKIAVFFWVRLHNYCRQLIIKQCPKMTMIIVPQQITQSQLLIISINIKLYMYGGGFGNKMLRQRQEEKKLQNHLERIRNARPSTSVWDMEAGQRMINNAKKNRLMEDKFTQIQRENRILLEKITTTMNKRGSSVSERQRQNKSLHGSFRKRQLQNIQIENARLLKRLQQKKSDYDADKLNNNWKKQKSVIKNIANYPFILKDGSRRERKRVFNKPINLDFDKNRLGQDIQLMRIRNFDGVSMVVTIKLDREQLTIIGDVKTTKDIKLIEIPREEAMEFISQECNGKIQNLFERLRYDQDEKVLYLISQDIDQDKLGAVKSENI